MFDITTEAVADTAPLHLKSAAGAPLFADEAHEKPVRIIVYSPGSKAYGAMESRRNARIMQNMQENGGKYESTSPEQDHKDLAEDLAAITVRFENFTYPPAAGAEGVELFEAFYLDRKLGFITKQVQKFNGDWGNFKPGSETS